MKLGSSRTLFSAIGAAALLLLACGSRGAVVLTNLPGTGTTGGAIALTTSTWEAAGLVTGNASVSFNSITGEFFNGVTAGAMIEGGIYSDSGGNPGSLLQAFTPVSVPTGTNPAAAFTVFPAAPINLSASTDYWFVLHDAAPFQWVHDNSGTTGTAPTPATGYSFLGYRQSTNTGASWSTDTSGNWTISVDAAPEPASLGILAITLFPLALRRRHARPC